MFAARAAATLAGPFLRGNRCVLEFGDCYFEVDPEVGGRIVSARVAGSELLVGRDVHPENYGSTFWTSPQADWAWPPVPAFDHGVYAVEHDATSCTLTSARVAGTGSVVDDVIVSKRFSVDAGREALAITYSIRNAGTGPKRLAAWEITRVAPNGLTFFASDAPPSPPPGGVSPPVVASGGCYWSRDDASVTHHAKLFASGRGWLAHVSPDRRLLLKQFQPLAPGEAAPGEAEIEVYAANPPGEPRGRYVEVENQGPYRGIAPGEASLWSVRWSLRALPGNVQVTPGNPDLIQIVEQLLR